MSADPPPATLRGALRALKTTHHSLNPTHIPISLGAPSPLALLRLAHQNTPHIFRGAFGDTPACEKWDLPYLKQAMSGRSVEVAETPLGNADSVITHNGEDIFVKPHITKMPMDQLLDALVTPEDGRVRYSQGQDNNLAHEFFPLSLDLPSSLPWADEAFDAEPDAGNIWIGEGRSVSALHKDNYENLYCMVMGRKTFALVSPVEVGAVRERSLRSATYVPTAEGLGVRMDDDDGEGWVHGWPTVDPDTPGVEGTEEERERGEGLTVLRGTLEKGDVLYLPALWYHKVSQEVGEDGVCVAVNYWYDMDYAGTFYPMMQFVRDAERVAAKLEGEVEKAVEGGERVLV